MNSKLFRVLYIIALVMFISSIFVLGVNKVWAAIQGLVGLAYIVTYEISNFDN